MTIITKIRKKLASRAVILIYHRVASVERDPWGLCVTPENFAEQLTVLKQYTHPISLQELVQAHREGNLPHRAVAITFDDGYVDNLIYAKPILEKYNIPATFFITTGNLGQEKEFWWDELEQVLLTPKPLPLKLSLEIKGEIYHWELEEYNNSKLDSNIKAWQAKKGARLFLYYSLWQKLQPLLAKNRDRILQKIYTWAEITPQTRPYYRPLQPQELPFLATKNLIEIGAHTLNHPFLSNLILESQREEIKTSKKYLEVILKSPVTSFSYPFGKYTLDTVSLVKTMGFICACTTKPETVWYKSDSFQLPRFHVDNLTVKQFAKQLKRWLND
jgi:peptidoglycan/xylan/chitin deacetylase (PgdA/CDA1 family)